MKKIIKIFVTVTMVLTLLVGCTSPIKNYQKAIDEAKIEASLDQIEDSVNAVYKSFNEFFSTIDLATAKLASLSGFADSKKLLADYSVLVEDTIKKVEAIDASKKDVKAANDQLLEALNKYKAMGDDLSGVIDLTTQLFTIMDQVTAGSEQLNTLGSPSTEYYDAINTFMLSNTAIIDELDNFDYNSILASENIDVNSLNEMKAGVDIILEGLASLPTTSDLDKTYNDLLITMYGEMKDMMTLFAENINTVKVIAEFEKSEDDYVKVGIDEANEFIKAWKEALKK